MRSVLSQIAVAVLFGASFLTSQADATNAFRHPKSNKKSKCPKRAEGGGFCDKDQTIVDTIVCASGAPGEYDTNKKDFDILRELALNSTIDFGALDEVTLFAPDDGAFYDLAVELGYDSTVYDEEDIFTFLAGALGSIGIGDVEAAVTAVLQYHVVPEERKVKDLDDDEEIETALQLDGMPATFTTKCKGRRRCKGKVKLLHNDSNLKDPRIHKRFRDCKTSQGLLHEVKDVLVPLQLTPEALP